MEIIILAGGIGSRLRSVVSDVPKCMADVGGKPFLHYLFKYLMPFSPSKVILSLGYKHEVVEEWLYTLDLPFEVVCKIEHEPLGTGGAIRYALSEVSEREAIIINGDTFYDADLIALLQFHQDKQAEVSMALKPMVGFDRYGAVCLDEKTSQITRFEEKKYVDQGLINGGIYVIERNALDHLPQKFSMENEYLALQVGQGKLYGYISDAYFIDIGIPEDYEKAQETLLRWK